MNQQEKFPPSKGFVIRLGLLAPLVIIAEIHFLYQWYSTGNLDFFTVYLAIGVIVCGIAVYYGYVTWVIDQKGISCWRFGRILVKQVHWKDFKQLNLLQLKKRVAFLDEKDQVLLIFPARIPIKTLEKYSGLKAKKI